VSSLRWLVGVSGLGIKTVSNTPIFIIITFVRLFLLCSLPHFFSFRFVSFPRRLRHVMNALEMTLTPFVYSNAQCHVSRT